MTTGERDDPDLAGFLSALTEAGWLSASDRVRVLTGGISGVTALIETPKRSFVAKTARARLLVAEDWTADRARVLLEGRILGLLDGHLGPLRTPRLLDIDEPHNVIAIEAFLPIPPTWKDALLAGVLDESLLTAVAEAMATLHQMPVPSDLPGFAAANATFHSLRVEAFYLRSAQRLPRHAGILRELAHDLDHPGVRRLVHGDLTPKNVAVLGPSDAALVDFEDAHGGEAAFDVGQLAAHLCLKAARLPWPTDPAFAAAAGSLAVAYENSGGPADITLAALHTGAVILARLVGASPVNYLTTAGSRRLAERLGDALLADGLTLPEVAGWFADAASELSNTR